MGGVCHRLVKCDSEVSHLFNILDLFATSDQAGNGGSAVAGPPETMSLWAATSGAAIKVEAKIFFKTLGTSIFSKIQTDHIYSE